MKKIPRSGSYATNLSEITQAITKGGYDLNCYDSETVFTPLISSITSQDPKKDEVINALLEAKADPNLGEEKDLPPLAYALEHKSSLKTVQRLLEAKALPYWGEEDSKTAVVSLYKRLPKKINIDHLHILMMLLMAGAEKVVFSGYDIFAKSRGFLDDWSRLPCAYAYLAIFGHFFLDSISKSTAQSRFLQILQEFVIPDLGILIFDYAVETNNEYLIKAVDRIVWCIKTNLLPEENVHHLVEETTINETPAWPQPSSELSLAVYNSELSKAQQLIDAKADVTFKEIDSDYSALDYAVKSKRAICQEGLAGRFERVKIITDALCACYQQTLLGVAQKNQPTPASGLYTPAQDLIASSLAASNLRI